jgi:hypothetical protein
MSKARRKLKKTAGKPAKRPKRRSSKKQFITRAEARRRAERHVLNRMFKGATVRDGAKSRWCVYDPTGKLAGREVWLVYKNPDNPLELKSASIIAVCKRTGRVLYEGSAHDEG